MVYTISVYKDKQSKIIIIPDAIDEIGLRREANRPIYINELSSNSIIGTAVLESIKGCLATPTIESNKAEKVFSIASGIKSWKTFSKDRFLVSIKFYPEKGYVFLPQKRDIKDQCHLVSSKYIH